MSLDFILIPACDICALAALIMGVVKGNLPIPMGISYGITVVAGHAFFFLFFALLRSNPREPPWRHTA